MSKTSIARGSAAGAMAAMLAACGHFPIAPEAFEQMSQKRAGLPADWTVAPMTGDASAVVGDYSVFNDPQLIAYVKEALENNRTLRATAENVRQSEALLRQSRAGLFPTVKASVGASERALTKDGDFKEGYSFGVSGVYNADIMGDISASIQSSRWGLRSTEATYEFSRRQLAAQTARAYFSVIERKLQLALNRRTLARAQDTFRITQARFNEGSVARDELVLGQSDLATSEANVTASEVSARTAERALEVLLGRFPQNKAKAPEQLPEPPAPPPLGMPELTVRARPDVVSAEFGILQAFANYRVATISRWPRLDVALSAALNNSSGGVSVATGSLVAGTTSNLFNFDNTLITLGATLAQTLFDGGAIQGRIDASNSVKRAALERYAQTVIQAYADVVDALDQYASLGAQGKSLQTASNAARETLRLGELRYSEGSQSLLDVLTVRTRADTAESAVISNRLSRLNQWLTLHQALGGDPTKPTPQAQPAAAGAHVK